MLSEIISEVVAELGLALAQDWLPDPLKKSLFINTGSESNEGALRIVKLYTGGYAFGSICDMDAE